MWVLIVAVTFGVYCGFKAPLKAETVALTPDKLQKLFYIRSQQIPLMEDFIRKYPDAPKRPDTLYRLGEAYFETAKYLSLQNDQAGAAGRQMKALQYLEELRTKYPTYRRLDEALFVLANTYIEKKMMAQAGGVLADIADRFPDSPVVQQASLLLGDHYFSEKQFARAEGFYLKAAQDEKMKSYLHYKLGWVAINQDQPAKALKYFEMVMNERSESNDYSREAAKEMIWPAVQVYGSNRVSEYLERTLKDPELVQTSLDSLAKGLQARGEHKAASDLYANLRTRYGTASAASGSDWLSAQIKSEEAMGHTDRVQNLLLESAATAAATPEALSALMSSAQKFHSEAQKTKDMQLKAKNYEMAGVYYSAYLSRTQPTDPNYALVNFYLGEALYARDKFAEARVAYSTSAKIQSTVQAQAAWSWLLTAEKLATGFQFKGKEFRATSSDDESYLEAARNLQSVNGITAEQKRRASYQSARLLYQLNDYERALPVFKSLAESYGSTAEGKLSAQLVLDIYNLKQDYKQVAELARSYSNSADASTRAELGSIEQKAQIKTINEEEKQAKAQTGDARLSALEDVARKYRDYANAYPKSEFADAAMWAAFQNFTEVVVERKATDLTPVEETFFALTRNFSRSKHVPAAVNLMGKFLSVRRIEPDRLRRYESYRDVFAQMMRATRSDERGPMAMLVYRLSTPDEKRALESEFANYPSTDSNREAVAFGRLGKVRSLHAKYDKIQLNSLKTMQRNTAQKLNLLDQLQKDVTDLAQLKVGEVTIAGLNILSDGFRGIATSFRTAPIPSQLQGENLQRYQTMVKGKVDEFEAKSAEAAKLAKDTAAQLGLSPS